LIDLFILAQTIRHPSPLFTGGVKLCEIWIILAFGALQFRKEVPDA